MLLKILRLALSASLVTTIVVTTGVATAAPSARDQAIGRLAAENGGARVSVNPATGAARFVRLPAGSNATPAATNAQARQDRAAAFVNRYAEAFGLRNGIADLKLDK